MEVNRGNASTTKEACSKLTIKTSQRRQWPRSSVIIINFEQSSHCSDVSSVDFSNLIYLFNYPLEGVVVYLKSYFSYILGLSLSITLRSGPY